MRALRSTLSALLLLFLAAPAHAATFNVNSLADGADATVGDGICATGGGSCTVRAAVEESAADASSDDIVLGPGTHSLVGRLNVISHDVRIRGAGARATTIRQTQMGHGVMYLNSASEVRDLTLTGGSASLAGGGLWVDVTATHSVLVERVAIESNQVRGGAGGTFFGGGLAKTGPGSLTVRSSTLSDNLVEYIDPTVPGGAVGAVLAHGGGPLNLVNVTIEGNEAAESGPGGEALGGGIFSEGGGATALTSVTLAGNAATGDASYGGNLASTGTGQVNVANSIVAYGSATGLGDGCDVSGGGAITSSGRNIETGSTCGFGAPSLTNTDPLLVSLADNGGPTDTMMPALNSPAINAAIGCPTPSIDQRGVTRPLGGACDIGAVEFVPAPAPPQPPATDSVAPIVSSLRVSNRRFRIGRPASRRLRSLPKSTRFIFSLSEASLVEFAFLRRATGRRGSGGGCKKPSRANRGRPRCIRWVRAGSLADNLPEGNRSLRFKGNVTRNGMGRTLAAGSYRVRIRATDPAGNRSVPVIGRFRVIR